MLHKNVIEKTNGFRELSDAELEAVSGGGEIIVKGDRKDDGWVGVSAEDMMYLYPELFGNADSVNGGPVGDGGGDPQGLTLLDKVPSLIGLMGLELNEHEKAFSLTLQGLKVPAPLADAIAKASGFLSSTQFKLYLESIAETAPSAITEALFGPPRESSGDTLEDFRNTWGPFLGPQFPE